MKYAWIEKHAQAWPVVLMCGVLDVSTSGFKAWRAGGKRSPRRMSDTQLVTVIGAIAAQFKGSYGSPRMHAELRERGYRVGMRVRRSRTSLPSMECAAR